MAAIGLGGCVDCRIKSGNDDKKFGSWGELSNMTLIVDSGAQAIRTRLNRG
jgi:hypothetical protein